MIWLVRMSLWAEKEHQAVTWMLRWSSKWMEKAVKRMTMKARSKLILAHLGTLMARLARPRLKKSKMRSMTQSTITSRKPICQRIRSSNSRRASQAGTRNSKTYSTKRIKKSKTNSHPKRSEYLKITPRLYYI